MKRPLPLWAAAAAAALACATAQGGELEKIRATGEIVLAHRDASIPFSYLDADKQPVGYSMDLCMKIVDAIRRELKLPQLAVRYLPAVHGPTATAVINAPSSQPAIPPATPPEPATLTDITPPAVTPPAPAGTVVVQDASEPEEITIPGAPDTAVAQNPRPPTTATL